ncbi:MAG TPA: outer membrane beta-barrel protein [Agriterribacter sp.]|nr:outer membrane beta-barrel protein [Agriterribacter sp.]
MKQVFFFAVLFIAATGATRAQLVLKPAVGINLTDFSKNPGSGEYQSKVGYQVGGSVSFGQMIYIEPGLFFVKKSTEYVQENTSQQDVKFDVSGIRIPLTVGVNLLGGQHAPIGLRAFGGASAFLLTDIKDLDTDDFKSANWGVFTGAELNISLFFMEFQYEWSLTNMQKNVSQVDVGKSRSLFINAGVWIPL